MFKVPDDLPDCRDAEQIEHDKKLADEFALPGSVQHFLLRQGFVPGSEEVAEKILVSIIRENEWRQSIMEAAGL